MTTSTTTSTPRPELPLSKDFEPEIDLTRKATTTGVSEAATGYTDVTVWISATKGGAAIHAALSKTAAERSATPGRYFALLQTADLVTQLAAYAHRTVWVVWSKAGDIESESFDYTVRRYASQ